MIDRTMVTAASLIALVGVGSQQVNQDRGESEAAVVLGVAQSQSSNEIYLQESDGEDDFANFILQKVGSSADKEVGFVRQDGLAMAIPNADTAYNRQLQKEQNSHALQAPAWSVKDTGIIKQEQEVIQNFQPPITEWVETQNIQLTPTTPQTSYTEQPRMDLPQNPIQSGSYIVPKY